MDPFHLVQRDEQAVGHPEMEGQRVEPEREAALGDLEELPVEVIVRPLLPRQGGRIEALQRGEAVREVPRPPLDAGRRIVRPAVIEPRKPEARGQLGVSSSHRVQSSSR